jgi:uncharacterized protein with PQ loop repeat
MNPDDPLPLAFVIVGTISSFILALSPIPLIVSVFRKKDVGLYKADAFIVAIPFGIANGTYSLYSGQTVSFISTMITFALYSAYLAIFLRYARSSRVSIYRKIVVAFVLAATITGIGPAVFRIVDSTYNGSMWLRERGGINLFIRTWLGVCATISVTLLLSGQVPAMIDVFKTRDARSISTEMTLGGLFASLAWMTYASLILDVYYIVCNGLGVIAGIILISLKLKFRVHPQTTPGSSQSVVFDEVPLESTVKDQSDVEMKQTDP